MLYKQLALFRFTYAVFPSIDWDAHTYHYDDPKTTHDAYGIVDKSLGELVHELNRRGWYDDTLIIMASDHGLSATHSHLDLGNFFKKHRYRVLEYPKLWAVKPNVSVFISGNSFASLSFLDKADHYYYQDLMNNHSSVMNALAAQDAIDFYLVRESPTSYRICNNEGTALLTFEGGRISYKPITFDVFDLGEIAPSDYRESFEKTFESDYPDCLWQCHQLMQSTRSGDVVISAALGYDLRDFWEIPEHKGSHGSLHSEHMHIPILTNKKGIVTQPIRSIEIHPIIKNWIDG